MKAAATLLLLASVAGATDAVSFKLPDAGGRLHTIADFDARYLLLVYQGIP